MIDEENLGRRGKKEEKNSSRVKMGLRARRK